MRGTAFQAVDSRARCPYHVVIGERFDVGSEIRRQHNWKTFKLALKPGTHELHVSSEEGHAELSEQFEVTGEHWAVIDTWYYPESHYNTTPRHFTFNMQEEPIYLQ